MSFQKVLAFFIMTLIVKSSAQSACSSNPCANGGTCTPAAGNNAFTCSCVTGYSGFNCLNVCARYSGASWDNNCTPVLPCCGNDRCKYDFGGISYAFGSCPGGGCCGTLNCYLGGRGGSGSCTNSGGDTGIFIPGCCSPTACVPNMCVNGACIPALTGSTYTCSCNTGFSGTYCNISACSSNPCANGGTCMPAAGNSFTCVCPTGYSGTTCITSACSSNPCANGGTCMPAAGNSFTCVCPTGYSGTTCITSACSSNPCANGGTCMPAAGNSFTCVCPTGYSGTTCITSACSSNPCRNGGTCILNTIMINTFTCACLTGYSDSTCTTSVCSSNPCQNNGTCALASDNTFTCTCRTGYSGSNCTTSASLSSSTTSSAAAFSTIIIVIVVVGGILLLVLLIFIVRRYKRTQQERSFSKAIIEFVLDQLQDQLLEQIPVSILLPIVLDAFGGCGLFTFSFLFCAASKYAAYQGSTQVQVVTSFTKFLLESHVHTSAFPGSFWSFRSVPSLPSLSKDTLQSAWTSGGFNSMLKTNTLTAGLGIQLQPYFDIKATGTAAYVDIKGVSTEPTTSYLDIKTVPTEPSRYLDINSRTPIVEEISYLDMPAQKLTENGDVNTQYQDLYQMSSLVAEETQLNWLPVFLSEKGIQFDEVDLLKYQGICVKEGIQEPKGFIVFNENELILMGFKRALARLILRKPDELALTTLPGTVADQFGFEPENSVNQDSRHQYLLVENKSG